MVPVPDHGETSDVGAGQLTGRRAFTTGGDSGIGRAVAIAFAREGADVAIGFLPEESVDAEETARWVRETGRVCVLVPADLRDEDAARASVRAAVDGLGGLDLLVTNAGFQMARRESFADVTSDELDRVMKTNLYALVRVTQEAARRSRPRLRVPRLHHDRQLRVRDGPGRDRREAGVPAPDVIPPLVVGHRRREPRGTDAPRQRR